MELLEYDISTETIAFSSLRHGGFSNGPYSSFNVNLYCGDSLSNVQNNRKLLCDHLGINEKQLIIPHQTHQTSILKVDDTFMGAPLPLRQDQLESKDALITNIRGVCLCVSTADCIPILIYDSTHKAVASIHAGWRGTVERISSLTISAMENNFGTIPADCKAVIGPGISLKNFEVGIEVYDTFKNKGFPMDKISRLYNKWHIDLVECNRLLLLSAGLRPSNIQISGICTYDHYHDFFSARRLGINSGRILTGIMIK